MSTKKPARRKKGIPNKDFEAMTVGGRIRWLLQLRRLTQSEAARQADISQSAISNIIRMPSRQPNSCTLLALATVLDCAPNFILHGSPEPTFPGSPKDHEAKELIALLNRLNSLERTQLLVMAKILASEKPDQRYGSPTLYGR